MTDEQVRALVDRWREEAQSIEVAGERLAVLLPHVVLGIDSAQGVLSASAAIIQRHADELEALIDATRVEYTLMPRDEHLQVPTISADE